VKWLADALSIQQRLEDTFVSWNDTAMSSTSRKHANTGLARCLFTSRAFGKSAFPFCKQRFRWRRSCRGVIGETAHVSQCIGDRLSVIRVEHPQRANRVHVEIGDHLPWHATASGLAVLAASPAWFVDSVLTNPLAAFTKHTLTDHTQLRLAIQDAIDLGFAVNLQGLDEGVVSLAAAIGEPGAGPVGAISIAAPLERFERATMLDLGEKVAASAHQISCSLFWISSR
jgi:IclR family acetate operon transcriptional repressor